MSEAPDRLDLAIVARQLGRGSERDLRRISRVMARCPWQLPAVVESVPYDEQGRPFPTLFYLTCPTAVAAVSCLESAGGVADLGAAVSGDVGLRRALARAETFERRRRTTLAARRPPSAAAPLDGGLALRAGIGGRIAGDDRFALKCLHAHASHALARPGYSVGELVLKRARVLSPLWCEDARCLRAGRGSRPVGGAGGDPREAFQAEAPDALRIALIDLGTNTCRLFLGEVGPGWCGPIEHRARTTTVVRLGQGVDRSGRLAPQAVRRTRDCLERYAARIADYEPAARRLIATSVLRDAADGREFLEAVRRDFSLSWRVLSGAEEGAAAFRGAVCGPAGRPGITLVIDIGGGSTELVVGAVPATGSAGDDDGRPAPCSLTEAARVDRPGPFFVRSVDIGAVRITERCFRHDPPTSGEWTAAVRLVRRALEDAVPRHVRDLVEEAIGVAGTVTTLVANKLGLREYRPLVIDGQPLHVPEIDTAIAVFRRLASGERAALPGIQPGREDVILAGALIAREVCRLFALPGMWCGESDILEGAALELADERRGR